MIYSKNDEDMHLYIENLKTAKDRYLIFIVVKDTPGNNMQGEIVEDIKQLGFSNFSTNLWQMYVGIINRGDVVLNLAADEPEKNLTVEWFAANSLIRLSSSAWRTGNYCSVIINGRDYAVHCRGVNIVVFDPESNKVISSVGFDSHDHDSVFTIKEISYKAEIKEKILSSNITLFGSEKATRDFWNKYSGTLRIKNIITGKREEVTESNNYFDNMPVKMCGAEKIKNTYIIVCRDNDNDYYKAIGLLDGYGYELGKNVIRYDLCDAILSGKKICTFLGYCQLAGVVNAMQGSQSFKSQYFLRHYHISRVTKPHQAGFKDFVFGIKIADYLIQIPLSSMFSEKDIEYDYAKDVQPECQCIYVPQVLFMGYYPYKPKNIKIKEYNDDSRLYGHLDYPFLYKQDILDNLVNQGKDNDEIFEIVCKENLFSEKEVLHGYKVAMKFIERQDFKADIHIYDYIKANAKRIRLWRDGLHYENALFFELARRIFMYLQIPYVNELDEYELYCKDNNIKFQRATEVPILPSVKKILDLQFEREGDTKYELWMNLPAKSRYVDLKTWIFEYCDYYRAAKTIKRLTL